MCLVTRITDLCGSVVLAQSEAPGGEMTLRQGVAEPDFQPYVFWAYGLACALIFVFTLWTLRENRRLARRIEELEARFQRAHPDP